MNISRQGDLRFMVVLKYGGRFGGFGRQGAAYDVEGTSACKYDYFTPEPRCVWYKLGDVDGGITIDGVMSVRGQWRYCFHFTIYGVEYKLRWRPLETVWRWLSRLLQIEQYEAGVKGLPTRPASYPQLPAPSTNIVALLPAVCA